MLLTTLSLTLNVHDSFESQVSVEFPRAVTPAGDDVAVGSGLRRAVVETAFAGVAAVGAVATGAAGATAAGSEAAAAAAAVAGVATVSTARITEPLVAALPTHTRFAVVKPEAPPPASVVKTESTSVSGAVPTPSQRVLPQEPQVSAIAASVARPPLPAIQAATSDFGDIRTLPLSSAGGRTAQAQLDAAAVPAADALLKLLADEWEPKGFNRGIDKLQDFGLPNGTPYSNIVTKFKALAMSELVSHRAFAPNLRMAYADVSREYAHVDRLVSHASVAGSPLVLASPRNSGGTQFVLPVACAIPLDNISSGKEYYNDEVVLFWKPPPFLSNWTPCAFAVHGIRDVCGEQFMIAEKARIFGDDVACAKIMATSDPSEHKSLGRKVRGFDHAFWELKSEDVVFSLLCANFAQNADARERLFATADRQIAEASALMDCGACETVRLEVPPGTKPLVSRPCTLNPMVETKVDAILDQYLAAGHIPHSQSSWASPLIVVPKTDGNLRLTVNYKKRNKLCSLGQQPQPRVDHIIDSLHKGNVFSMFDLNSAFHQITVEEDTGSSVAPSWFTMVINEVVKGLDLVLAYVEDVIVFDADPVHYVANIPLFLERLRECNLKLSPFKSRVGAKETVCLGHSISPAGVSPRADKVEVLTKMPLPTNVKQLRSLLGGLSNYRKFIKGLAVRVKPRTDLVRKDTKFRFTPVMADTVKALLATVSELPFLAFQDWEAVADSSRPLRLCCDACVVGFGVALEQVQANGSVRPVLFVNRATLEAERNWTVLDLEAGSIVWAIKILRGYFCRRADMYATIKADLTAKGAASIFDNHYMALWGCLVTLLSDNGMQLRSKLSMTIYELKTKNVTISSDHPQTNGGAERVDHTMAQMLAVVVNERQDDWDVHLLHAEFAHNNSMNTTTGLTPNKCILDGYPVSRFLFWTTLAWVATNVWIVISSLWAILQWNARDELKVYNSAATIRQGVQKHTDELVLKAKLSLSYTGPY
ncbi:unnamed protein product [Ectocarpus sp. CCAP 1310/34]|nr:unnamed protein product [Ectocarpus sp. CCAP 1310/34]